MKKENKPKVDKEYKWWGIGAIIGGLILMYFTNIIVGAIVLMFGIVTLILRKDWNLLVIGILVILLGGTYFIDELMSKQSFSYISVILILIGVYALIRYYKSGEKEVSNKKKLLIIGLVLLVLIMLVSTFLFESTISTENIKIKIYGEYFTSNDSLYSEYSLNKGLADGTYTTEYAYNELTKIEKEINESETKINEASKYSLITYIRWSGFSERKEYTEIYPNGYRSMIDFERTLISAGAFEEKCDSSGCNDGWCKVEGTDYCCPKPNMKIVDGYCY